MEPRDVIPSPPPLPPSPRAGLCTYLIRMSAVQTARHSSKVLPRDWGRVESRHTRKNKQWSSRAFPFLAEQRGSVRYFNKTKKVPREDSSVVFLVKCWASDVMALHTALPYDWTTQRRSQHSWLMLLNVPLVCRAPPAGPDNGVRLEPSVCGACCSHRRWAASFLMLSKPDHFF